MSKRLSIIAVIVLSLAVFGCGDGGSNEAATTAQTDHSHDGHDHAPGEGHGHDHPAAATGGKTGAIVETMDSGGYTYVQVDCDGEMIWAAAPQRTVAVGNTVTINTAMPMKNFRSDKLDRTFDVVYFVNDFGDAGAAAGHGGGMGGVGGMGGMGGEHPAAAPPAEIDLSGIERAAGGKTVAEVWAERQALAGGSVVVTGKVVKFNSGIMGKNWLHLRDGSGAEGTNDLTITTDGFAAVGDLVVVTGKVGVDRDFGAGYRYDVIVEDAKVVKK